MEISNLPSDLLEEILAKLPLTSPRKIRLTCKTWYTLFTTQSFAKKHINEAAKSESKLFIMLYSKVSLMCLNLQNIHNNHVEAEPSIKRLGKFNRSRAYDICQILYCDGLLLCIQTYNNGIVVWNPYLVQKRWIECRTAYNAFDVFAIGYKEKLDKSRSYKILKYRLYCELDGSKVTSMYEIYDLESGSWKLFDMTTPHWIIERDGQHGVSLKGNTFFVAQERKTGSEKEHVLLCFDFRRERFGPSLSFPFQSYVEDFHDKDCYVALSSVREEKLVVSIQKMDWQQNTLEMEVWVTSEITPETVLWSKLLVVDMRKFAGCPFYFSHTGGSFLIDEEKKFAVFVSENHWDESCVEGSIIGENGCLERVNIGKDRSSEYNIRPLMCSYVPSCVHIE